MRSSLVIMRMSLSFDDEAGVLSRWPMMGIVFMFLSLDRVGWGDGDVGLIADVVDRRRYASRRTNDVMRTGALERLEELE